MPCVDWKRVLWYSTAFPWWRIAFAYQAHIALRIIRSNSEFDEICLRSILRNTVQVTKKFCTFQEEYSTAVLECTKFRCGQIDVREDIIKCILIKYEIRSKPLWWDGHQLTSSSFKMARSRHMLIFCINCSKITCITTTTAAATTATATATATSTTTTTAFGVVD